jgi:hypothetical protein
MSFILRLVLSVDMRVCTVYLYPTGRTAATMTMLITMDHFELENIVEIRVIQVVYCSNDNKETGFVTKSPQLAAILLHFTGCCVTEISFYLYQ